MKKAKIIVSYNAEKYSAIEDYAAKKGVDLMAEISETIDRVFEKCVPAPVRDFIESKQKKEEEARAQAAGRTSQTAWTSSGEGQA